MQTSTQGSNSTSGATSEGDSSLLQSSRRGLSGLIPRLSILLLVGLVYVYIEYNSIPAHDTRQGTYHVQTQEKQETKGGEGFLSSIWSTAAYRPPESEAALAKDPVSSEARWKDAHADQLACDFPYQKVDPQCPRFVHLPITRGGGLGNKFFTYILGVLLAIDMKATHLYTGTEFQLEDNQDHGNYPWVEEVFQFTYREMNYSQAISQYKPAVKVVSHQVWENITRDYASECNVVYHADDFVCNYMICYYSETPRVYERIKSIVRCKMMHSRFIPPPLLLDPEGYNVACHIRMGDSGLGSLHRGDRDYFQRVKDALGKVLEGFPVRLHFFAELPGSGNNAPPEFAFLEELFPRDVYHTTYHTDMSVKDTMVHMMSSDLLITSGSSFSFVAASLSYKPVVLFDTPKEGAFFGVYMDTDYVKLSGGNIIDQSLSEVRATVMYKWSLFHDHVVPGRVRLRDASNYADDMAWRNLGIPPPSEQKPEEPAKAEESAVAVTSRSLPDAAESSVRKGRRLQRGSEEAKRRRHLKARQLDGLSAEDAAEMHMIQEVMEMLGQAW